jgi:2-C-methyl-D-erythritol 4-phosphate cytidylyltransferase
MNAALILAGGTGERLSELGSPKQFYEVGGKPIIQYALSSFESCADIGLVCVVIAEQWRHLLGDFAFADPGKTRQHSIYNGLCVLRAYSPELVVVHDAVRPLITSSDVSDCIIAAKGYDGSTPFLPVKDTIYQSTDGETITALLDRDKLFIGQTPECYDFAKYLAIHERLSDGELSEIRGSSEIAVRGEMTIHLFKGNERNLKITTASDLKYLKHLMELGL